jgi:nicotinamide-nucleotide amidase
VDLELVTIGTELLLGYTVDTNSAYLGQLLAGIGVRITRRTSVPDTAAAVSEAVAEALGRSRFVITTGGLGPTNDDLSKQAVAALFGLPLEFDARLWAELEARWARLGRTLAPRNRCQAEVPRGATVLPNPRGTAPGLWISGERGEVVMLPGVPGEMRGLLREEVAPRLAKRAEGRVVRSLVLRTTGIAESLLAERLEPVEGSLAPLTLAYLPSLFGVDLRLTAWNIEPGQADRMLREAADRLSELLGAHFYGEGEVDLAQVLLEDYRNRGRTLALAESCTGGMVGERLTAIPGSSAVFRGGLIAYHDDLKRDLGVDPRILEEQGAVSEEIVTQLADRARERYGSTAALAISGIAGPDGGSETKPVGTVWLAICDEAGREAVKTVFPGSRHEIRVRASQAGLWRLLRRGRERPAPGG